MDDVVTATQVNQVKLNTEAMQAEATAQYGTLAFRCQVLAGQLGAANDTIRELEAKVAALELEKEGPGG